MAEYISFQPSDFFNPVLYTGTGAEQTISGVGFEPGLTWCKDRTNSYDQVWYDAARGATKRITCNTDTVESDQAQGLKSWNSDGFVVGTGSNINNNTNEFVSWNWKAGTTSGLTGGTITPSAYSINTTSGFGAYAYTGNGTSGATIPHGLGAAPKFMIIKCLDTAGTDWVSWISPMAVNEYLYLNGTATTASDTAFMNSVLPSSTLITLGDKGNVNANTKTFIVYAWAEKKGYSSFGEYTGNGNANGSFIYTGFRPAFILLKKSNAAINWVAMDDKRQGFNPNTSELYPSATSAECDTGCYRVDLLSNGFKMRNSSPTINDGSYVYAAFAEFPLVSSNDVPGVAR